MRKRVRDVMFYYVTFASLLAIAAHSLADGTHIGVRKTRSITTQSGEMCDTDDASQNDRLSALPVASGRRSQKKHKKMNAKQENVLDSDALETENDQDQEAINGETDSKVTTKDSSVEEVNGSPILEVIDDAKTRDPGAAGTCSGAAGKSKKTSKHRSQTQKDRIKDKVLFDDTSVDDGDDGSKPEKTRRALKSSKKVSVEMKNSQGSSEKSAEITNDDSENMRIGKIAVVSDEITDDDNKTPSKNSDSGIADDNEVKKDFAAQIPEADDTSAQVSTPEKQDDQNNIGIAEVNDDDEAKKRSVAKKKSGASRKGKKGATGTEIGGENRRHLVLYDDGRHIHAKKLRRGNGGSKKQTKNINKNVNVNNIVDSNDRMTLGSGRRAAIRNSPGEKSHNENRNYNANVNTVASKPSRPVNKGTIFKVVPVRRSFHPFNYNSGAADNNRNVNANTNVNRNVIGRNNQRDAKRYIIRDGDGNIDSGAFKIHSRGVRFRGRNWKVSTKGMPHFLETASNIGQAWIQPRGDDQQEREVSYNPY